MSEKHIVSYVASIFLVRVASDLGACSCSLPQPRRLQDHFRGTAPCLDRPLGALQTCRYLAVAPACHLHGLAACTSMITLRSARNSALLDFNFVCLARLLYTKQRRRHEEREEQMLHFMRLQSHLRTSPSCSAGSQKRW